MLEFSLFSAPSRIPCLADADGLVVTRVETDGAGRRVAVAGDLDSVTAAAFRDAVLAALPPAPGRHMCVDLAEVPFIDAAGVRALLQCRRRADHRRIVLVVTGARPLVRRVLEILGVLALLTREDAA
jgi:anti-anti-sigma factor